MFEVPKLSDPMYTDSEPSLIEFTVDPNPFMWMLEITAQFCNEHGMPFSTMAFCIQEPLVINEDF